MVELIDTSETRASAVRCMESFRDKIEMLMKAGDILDHCTSGRSTREETAKARARSLKIWQETSCNIAQAAEQGGADKGSFRRWLIKEGLHTPKTR
tara:strand:+ start:388 stop:675 length:288 start_codon:yes stop_codon:yes gene_type:complete